ncbi:hypothetical protein BDA96_04G071200 [Sorghum bicolor]|uniref:Uncharacterized protein n=1 Tax=Sorghum bicolor TaxID=4558 RepID=A0A921R156_SORBI|nr:hypothetical protein BDA96_04G071200 [Sorghum bicolor]
MFRHHTKGKQMCMCNFGIIPRKREHVAKALASGPSLL